MFRSTSPYMPEGGAPYGGAPQSYSRPGTTAPYPTSPMMPPGSPYGPQVNVAPTAPGSVMYTTTVGPNGQPVYHPYTAVPASYNTDAGTVTGIQWVSSAPTHQLPANAAPATPSFAEQMQRGGQMSGADQKALKDWQKAEEKRRRKEEKEASRQLRDKDRYGREDADIRIARERDAVTRERRKSFSASTAPPTNSMAFPGAPGSNYGGGQPQFPGGYPGDAPSAGYGHHGRERSVGGGLDDLNSQFGGLEIERGSEYGEQRQRRMSNYGNRSRPTSAYGAPPGADDFAERRERRMSGNYGAAGGAVPPRPYSAAGVRGGGPGAPGAPGYGADGAHGPYSPNANAYARSRPGSPNPATIPGPYGSHSPNPQMGGGGYGGYSHSRPASPNPRPGAVLGAGGYGHGGMDQQFPGAAPAPLAAPEGFARPPNAALPYTPFDTQKVCDMEESVGYMPKLPPILNTHDVYGEDWSRLMGDITRAWKGQLNVPTDNGRPPKRSTLVGQILDIWNDNFFGRRGIELVLYKGRERRSGPRDGLADLPEYLFESELSSDSSDSESPSDDSDFDDPRGGAGAAYGNVYGGGYAASEAAEARRHRREAKVEKKRRRKEKRVRRKAKAREKKYALYMICTGGPGAAAPGGYPPPGQYQPGGYGATAGGGAMYGGVGAPGGYGHQGGAYGAQTPSVGYGAQTPSVGYGPTTPSIGYGPTTPSHAGGYGGLPHY